MRIIATDDEKLALESLIFAIKEAESGATVDGFSDAQTALSFARENAVDVAFLDIEMREMNGLELAKKLKGIHPKINIVFVTGHTQYSSEAFSLYVSGYVTKPANSEKIKLELKNLRHPVANEICDKIVVKTFGNFEVYYNNQPVKFKYQKTKELLAVLIDRNGANVTAGEIMTLLWEDDANGKKSYYNNISTDLVKTLKNIGCEDIFGRRRGEFCVIPDKISCDYFDWIKGIPYAVNSYRGEYMSQYSWAEATHCSLDISLQ